MVEGIGKQLQLSREQKAPSANTLHYFGNTSSSTVWYSLSFIEDVPAHLPRPTSSGRWAGCLWHAFHNPACC